MMAENRLKEKPSFTFTWRIENFNYCVEKQGEILRSPNFVANNLDKTLWSLWILCPRGHNECPYGEDGKILIRLAYLDGTGEFTVNYELSIVSKDGADAKSMHKKVLFQQLKLGENSWLLTRDILNSRKTDLLPNDTLTVRCRMWNDRIEKQEQCFARTRVGIQQTSFDWNIHGFTMLQPNDIKSCVVKFDSKEYPQSVMKLCLSDNCQGEVNIQIVQVGLVKKNLKFFKISLIDSEQRVSDFRYDEDVFVSWEGRQVWNFPTFINRNKLLENKNLYFPNDTLLLRCECGVSIGVIMNKIEEADNGLPEPRPQVDCSSTNKTMKDDFLDLFEKGLFDDLKIKVGTVTFPVHKGILSARSPIFHTMLTTDMAEKTSNCITIADLKAETVRKMLVYIYTDNVDNLNFDSCTELYFAADKYGLLQLKKRCSSFLIANLNVRKVCDVLGLADRHQDNDMKSATLDFMLQHAKEVVSSQEWKQFEKYNNELAIETMRIIFLKKMDI